MGSRDDRARYEVFEERFAEIVEAVRRTEPAGRRRIHHAPVLGEYKKAGSADNSSITLLGSGSPPTSRRAGPVRVLFDARPLLRSIGMPLAILGAVSQFAELGARWWMTGVWR